MYEGACTKKILAHKQYAVKCSSILNAEMYFFGILDMEKNKCMHFDCN